MDIMDKIRLQQSNVVKKNPPIHRPQMLYIGCVDARLDPITDIGIEKGKALIFRNIAALVNKCSAGGGLDPESVSENGEIPQHTSVGAVLEFFLNHIPFDKGTIRHIAVSGHTDCGGLKACRQGHAGPNDYYLPRYLQNLQDVRNRVMEQAQANKWDQEQVLHALEEESVRQSIANLQGYASVQRALEQKTVQLHGWVIDTATRYIRELNPETGVFEPIGTHQEYTQAS